MRPKYPDDFETPDLNKKSICLLVHTNSVKEYLSSVLAVCINTSTKPPCVHNVKDYRIKKNAYTVVLTVSTLHLLDCRPYS